MPAETHLTGYELDALQVGQASEAARAHAAGCARCTERLERQRSIDQAARGDPAFARTWAGLAAGAEPVRRRRWVLAFVPALAAALIAAVVVTRPTRGLDDETRIKGPVVVRLRGASGEDVTRARAGERVALMFGAGGHRYAVVLAVEGGSVSQLWPPGQGGSGEAPRGALAQLDTLTVTPGPVQLWAVASDGPLTLAEARRRVEQARAGQTSVGADVARLDLEVAP